ncbi:MAG: hypothetical protein NT138_11755 [Planctomycetales bacterium]|nr:hypothetical protein [Planctomycetales bacterium]
MEKLIPGVAIGLDHDYEPGWALAERRAESLRYIARHMFPGWTNTPLRNIVTKSPEAGKLNRSAAFAFADVQFLI